MPAEEAFEEEAACRAAIAAGDVGAWFHLGWVLAGQPAVVKRLQRPGGRTRDPEC